MSFRNQAFLQLLFIVLVFLFSQSCCSLVKSLQEGGIIPIACFCVFFLYRAQKFLTQDVSFRSFFFRENKGMNIPIAINTGFHRGPHGTQCNFVLICIIFIAIWYRLQQNIVGYNDVPFTHLASLKNLLDLL